MPIRLSRRAALLGAAATGVAGVGGALVARRWYRAWREENTPPQTVRLPAAMVPEIATLPGLFRLGPADARLVVYEFYDYNCPYCRVASPELAKAVADRGDLAVGLVNNPFLAPASREAAAVEIAVLRSRGPADALAFYKAMFERTGPASQAKALAVAQDLGFDKGPLAQAARTPEILAVVERQLAFSRDLGLTASPAFAIGPSGVFGFPGRRRFDAMVDSLQRCGDYSCA